MRYLMNFLPSILVGALIVSSSLSNAQQTDFLKNYKAPDFKYRELTADLDGSNNFYRVLDLEENRFNGNVGISYLQFANSQSYQGFWSASSTTDFNHRNPPGQSYFRFEQTIRSHTENRFYFKPRWFFGAHDYSNFQIVSNNQNLSAETITVSQLNFNPTVAVGFGRIEPVSFARTAMDMERLLKKGNCLSGSLSDEDRKALADKIAEVQNNRYYDLRLGRIDQLEALDALIGDRGIVSKRDIAYFSRMQDGFLYARFNERKSGYRHELGAVQGLTLYGGDNNAVDVFGTYGFYRFSWFLPSSYRFQHNFESSLISGIREDQLYAWLTLDYSIGYYPTTRTELKLGVLGSTYLGGDSGALLQPYLSAYYYISPRVRFSISGTMQRSDGYRPHQFVQISAVPSSTGWDQFTHSIVVGFDIAIF